MRSDRSPVRHHPNAHCSCLLFPTFHLLVRRCLEFPARKRASKLHKPDELHGLTETLRRIFRDIPAVFRSLAEFLPHEGSAFCGILQFPKTDRLLFLLHNVYTAYYTFLSCSDQTTIYINSEKHSGRCNMSLDNCDVICHIISIS
jgi:hypothetical protein